MAEKQVTYSLSFEHWLKQNFTEEQILDELIQQGYADDQIADIQKLYKKKRLDERTRKGFIYMGIGSSLGLLSCLCAIMGVLPELRDFILYGLTSIGIVLALVGGYFVFE